MAKIFLTFFNSNKVYCRKQEVANEMGHTHASE